MQITCNWQGQLFALFNACSSNTSAILHASLQPTYLSHSQNDTAMVIRRKLLAVFLFLCFGVLAAFSPLLHNHDIDLSDAHQDCVSCQWSQSPTSLSSDASDLLLAPFFEVLSPPRSQQSHQHALFLISNRGPPSSV